MTALNAEISDLGRKVHTRARPALEHFITTVGLENGNAIHEQMHKDFRIFSGGLATLRQAEGMPALAEADSLKLLNEFLTGMVTILKHTHRREFVRLFKDEPEGKLIALHGLRYAFEKAIGEIEMFQHRHRLQVIAHEPLARFAEREFIEPRR